MADTISHFLRAFAASREIVCFTQSRKGAKEGALL